MYPPYDRAGNLLKVGDTVRGVTKNSAIAVIGVVDEIRLFNNLNIRLLVGDLITDRDGNAVSGYHYAEAEYLELAPEQPAVDAPQYYDRSGNLLKPADIVRGEQYYDRHGNVLDPAEPLNDAARRDSEFLPQDGNGMLLKVGDTVRGVTADSTEVVIGTISEIRAETQNIRLQMLKNDKGRALSGYQWAESGNVKLAAKTGGRR